MNGYDLTRQWFDFAFEKPECKVQHTAIYCWIVELNNRMGWKEQFGLPSQATIEGLSIGDKRTYLNALRDIAEWGFIEIVQEAKNQFQSCIIKICHREITPASTPALDTALSRQNTDTTHSRTPIDKPLNNETNKQINKVGEIFNPPLEEKKEKGPPKVQLKGSNDFNPLNVDLPFGELFKASWSDWVQHRIELRKKLTPSMVKQQLKKLEQFDERYASAVLLNTVEKGWLGLVYEIKIDSIPLNGHLPTPIKRVTLNDKYAQ